VQANSINVNAKKQHTTARKTLLNTAIIYFQRFATAGFALITTPLVLNSLGVEDFGIYTLTVGFVGFVSFLTWSLSSCTQRYIGVTLGAGNIARLKYVFSTAFFIHFIYGLVFLLGIATVGLYLQDEMLSIPPHRLPAAETILHLVALLTFFSIITIPFTGVLRAYERFKYLAILGIIESSLKLFVAALLLFVEVDRLLFYSAMLVAITAAIFVINMILTFSKVADIKLHPAFIDRSLIREMLNFFGWSLLGAVAIVSRNQGVTVLINMFFGVVRNAAYGIALQVSAAIAILSQGVIGAISPQIVKAAGSGDYERMISLMRTMSKFSIFSISLIAIPLYFEAPFLLQLWLKTVPEGTVTYVRLIIIFGQIMLLSAGIQTVFDALGKVKRYNIIVSIILILNLPISYILFRLGYQSSWIIIVGMLLEVLSLGLRLWLLQREVAFSIADFLKDAIFKIALPAFVIATLIMFSKTFISHSSLSLITSFLVSFTIYPVIIYFVAFDKSQQEMFKSLLANVARRFQRS
jgi:O-antigen/teichoic acid export membrane protein